MRDAFVEVSHTSLIATKGPYTGAANWGIQRVVRGAGEGGSRTGLGVIFPSRIPVTTLGKNRVGEVFEGQ